MSLITELISNNVSRMSIFEIAVLRVFGVGNDSVIRKLDNIIKSWKPDSPDFKGLENYIQKEQEMGKGEFKMLRWVYGNLQIERVKITEILEKLWDFSQTVWNGTSKSQSFEELHVALNELRIPAVNGYGQLLPWLILSDLAEWNICTPPKIDTLVTHIQNSTGREGPKGPRKALDEVVGSILKAEYEAKGEVYTPPDAVTLRSSVIKIWTVLHTPPPGTFLMELMEQCKSAQGRAFSVIDMEHILCKVARYSSEFKLRQPRAGRDGSANAKDRSSRSKSKVRKNGASDTAEGDGDQLRLK